MIFHLAIATSKDSLKKFFDAIAFQPQIPNLTKSQLAELQPLAVRNPLLARKIIRNEKLRPKYSIAEHFKTVEDPRTERSKEHLLIDILSIEVS